MTGATLASEPTSTRRSYWLALAPLGLLALWTVPLLLPVFVAFAAALAVIAERPARGLALLTWLLPFHILLMAVLFGGLGWPASVVRTLAAWKEVAILVLFAAVVLRAAVGRRPRADVCWIDLATGALITLAVAQLVAEAALPRHDVGAVPLLYGLRDAAFFLVPYYIGRATPEIADDDAVFRRIFLVGLITSAIAIVEWFFVPPQLLVLIGVALYYSDFLGAQGMLDNFGFGLPANYWTSFGGMELRRAGSVELSGQGFAVPFLLIIPAATVWLLSRSQRTKRYWLGYGVIWGGLLFSVTRMTIISCLIQTLGLALLFRRRAVALMAVGSALAALGIAILVEPRLGVFLWETLTWQQGSSLSHLRDYANGLRALFENPFGAGLGTTDDTAVRFGREALSFDNAYLKMGVQLGIAGLVLFVALLVGIGVTGLRLVRSGASLAQRRLGAVVLAATGGVALNAMTNSVFGNFILSYLYFWLAGAAVTLSRRGTTHPREPG